MDARSIRERFLSFFVERDHVRVPSSSLIPPPESGLLLTNAGMNQFIPYFLGRAEPPFRRATSCQKCFRTVDIDNVGHTDRHLTLFEMLGNHVFMQDEVDAEENVLRELPAKNIDTGSSLERVAVVLQGVENVFETDLLRPVLEVVESLSGTRHGTDPQKDVSLKIVAEHGRATTFLIADGVFPSNEGRGYVLRRMLRRMVTHARRLGVGEAFTSRLVEATADTLGDAYPELVENRSLILQVAGSEEERFASTLRQGLGYFERPETHAGSRFSGDDAFKLHDTYGFPRELTKELAEEAGLEVDWNRFDELMTAQRERARSALKRGDGGL